MSNIKHVFTSRFEDGYILEVDWNQLEIVILQIESQDLTLKDELNEGLDLHTAMTADVARQPYLIVANAISAGDDTWIKRRKQIKSARFALQYGASAAKIAKVAGWDEGSAREFVDVYYSKYKGIKRWQQMVKKQVLDTARPKDDKWYGQYTSPNGRRYIFQGEWNPKYNKVNFPPTKMFNYPIQGLASDFVKVMRSKLIKELIDLGSKGGYYLPINTIHDSVMFDVGSYGAKEHLEDTIDFVYGKAPLELHDMLLGTRKVEVPFRYSIKSGKYWS